jgi:hemerythrin-like metal-binding protein
MAFIEWGPEFELGIAAIDNEHKEFFGYVNDLEVSMMAGSSKEEIHDVLENITNYSRKYFDPEEKLMEECAYPDMEEHKEEHRQFLAQIKEFMHKEEVTPVGLSVELFNFLRDWVNNHLQSKDKAFAVYYQEHRKDA